jgi:hypothetical protein
MIKLKLYEHRMKKNGGKKCKVRWKWFFYLLVYCLDIVVGGWEWFEN